MEKLRHEGAGILAWLVRGAVDYVKDGLEPPPDVAQMTNDYLQEQDVFARWLADMEPCDPKEGVSASRAFESFKDWCIYNSASLSPSTFTAFGKVASARGIAKGKGVSGVSYGLRPLDDAWT